MNIRFLGTGAAEGIPSFGCTCRQCKLARKEGGLNVRKRASLLVEVNSRRILLDTPPEISLLLNQAEVFNLTAIFLSHEHYDHIGGLIEFEFWNQVLPIFAGFDTLPHLRLTPRLESRALLSGFSTQSFLHFADLRIMPFKVSPHVPCYGFSFEANRKRVVHFTDSSSELSDLHRHIAKEADLVIFHTPTFETNRNHLSVQNVISLVKDSSLKRVIITHINHNNFSHTELEEKVAPWAITVAHDGLSLEV